MAQVETAEYTLFWEAMSGAMVVEVLLEEMGLPYRLKPVDMAAGEHRSKDYLKINPTGQVPALSFPDRTTIGESAAIILSLGDRHPETDCMPCSTAPERPFFLRWLIFLAASPYMTFVQFNHPERFLDDTATHDALIDNARRRLLTHFDAIDAAISGSPFFLPGGATALDFYTYMLVFFFPERERLLADRPKLRDLFNAVSERQSAQKVIQRHTA